MQSVIDFILKQSLLIKVIIVLLLIVIYSMFAVILNKLHSAKYGKTTPLVWVPIINIYLLGKLVIHAIFGVILILGLLFGICISFNIKGLESIHNVMPKEYVFPYQIAYLLIILILFIIAKLKHNRIVLNGTAKDEYSAFVSKDFEKKEPNFGEIGRKTVSDRLVK